MLQSLNLAIENKQAEMDAIGYDAAALTVLQNECATLLPYVAQLEKINQRENNLALIKAALKHLKSNISEAENRLAEVKLKGTQAETERDIYAKAFEEHVHVLSAITALDPWVEKEKMLPVAEERNATALNRVLELTAEITGINDEISERQAEADKEILAMAGMEEAQAIVNGLDTEVNAINSMVKEKQMRIGALQQKSEQIAKLKQDIAALQDKWNANREGYADNTASIAIQRVSKEERKNDMAKRSCRRTTDENAIHNKAVKIRKMTDEQLVHYVEDRVEKARSEGFNCGKTQAPKHKTVDITGIIEEISFVKGIGATKLADIKASDFKTIVLGEERMEIYSMISCSIVVLMIDSTAITIICSAIPDFFGFFFCKILILFHSIKERFVKFVAPVTLAVSDLESFVNQILSGCHKVN